MTKKCENLVDAIMTNNGPLSLSEIDFDASEHEASIDAIMEEDATHKLGRPSNSQTPVKNQKINENANNAN